MNNQILDDLRKAILEYSKELAIRSAEKVVKENIDPVEALDIMTTAIRQVGDGFGRGELWLPDLVGASTAMSGALPILEDKLKKEGKTRESLGVVVLGSVYGDIHTIGKDMVGAFLTASGFIVHDVGTNVTAEGFVDAVRRYKAHILAMSALMTMTAPEQKITIELLKKERFRDKVKVMVGGGAITQAFADEIGADGYDATAPGAMELAKRLVEKYH